MSALDDLKDELAFKIRQQSGSEQELREAIDVGCLMLDAGATLGEAIAAAKMRLKEAA